MNEYKGIYYQDDTEQHFYEGGAHFKYKDLYTILESLAKITKQRTQSAQSRNSKTRNAQSLLYQTNTKLKTRRDNSELYKYIMDHYSNIQTSSNNKIKTRSLITKRNKVKDDSTKRHLSVTKTTMPNTRNSNNSDQFQKSNTIMNYNNSQIKKNRHISLEATHSDKPLLSNKVLNGKKNSMSKNRRALEYSMKVMRFNKNMKPRKKENCHYVNNIKIIDDTTLNESKIKSRNNKNSISFKISSVDRSSMGYTVDRNRKEILSKSNYTQIYLKKNLIKSKFQSSFRNKTPLTIGYNKT